MQKLQIHTDLEQGSDEWHKLRLGKITGSCFHKLLGTKTAREKYLYDRANEIVTGCESDGEEYVNVHIKRGWEYEPIARAEYIADTFTAVDEVGLMQLGDYMACSPDGLVGNDAVLEIKCPRPEKFFELVEKGFEAIDKKYIYQMQLQMKCTNSKQCHFFNYLEWNDEQLTHEIIVTYDESIANLIIERIKLAVKERDEVKNGINSVLDVSQRPKSMP